MNILNLNLNPESVGKVAGSFHPAQCMRQCLGE